MIICDRHYAIGVYCPGPHSVVLGTETFHLCADCFDDIRSYVLASPVEDFLPAALDENDPDEGQNERQPESLVQGTERQPKGTGRQPAPKKRRTGSK